MDAMESTKSDERGTGISWSIGYWAVRYTKGTILLYFLSVVWLT